MEVIWFIIVTWVVIVKVDCFPGYRFGAGFPAHGQEPAQLCGDWWRHTQLLLPKPQCSIPNTDCFGQARAHFNGTGVWSHCTAFVEMGGWGGGGVTHGQSYTWKPFPSAVGFVSLCPRPPSPCAPLVSASCLLSRPPPLPLHPSHAVCPIPFCLSATLCLWVSCSPSPCPSHPLSVSPLSLHPNVCDRFGWLGVWPATTSSLPPPPPPPANILISGVQRPGQVPRLVNRRPRVPFHCASAYSLIQFSSKTLIIPQGAILLWSWRAHKKYIKLREKYNKQKNT